MPRQRFDRLSPEKRERILRAAGRLFAEHGYDGATVQVILKQAGISAGAAYYYFDNKADLFEAVVCFYMDALVGPTARAPSIQDADSFWRAFLGSVEVALSQNYETHKVVAALRRTWMMSRELRERPVIEQQFGRNEALLRDLVTTGRSVGAIRTDLPCDLLMRCVVALNDAFDDWMADMPAEAATAQVTHAIAAFRTFLAPQKTKRQARLNKETRHGDDS